MNTIKRILATTITKSERSGFITVIYGPRRVGKTVLLEQITKNLKKAEILYLNGDTEETREKMSSSSRVALEKMISRYDTIVIDEAQRIKNIGLSLKIIIDMFPEKRVFVTGSSSLELVRGIQEPLTGRTRKFQLYPLSTEELTQLLPDHEKSALLEQQLIFGGYPYLTQLTRDKEKQEYLISIADDYLFRDILNLKDINSPENLRKLATLLAFQVGSEVSLNELANNLNVDIKTIQRYLTLLKQGFIIFEIGAFSRNLRKEVVKSKKYYFTDLGIRNALTRQFQSLVVRTDVGALWENFLAVERKKKHEYERTIAQYYFWRTYQKAEIDWVEIQDDTIHAYEFKWKTGRRHTPKAFKDAYCVEAEQVSRENYLDFIT
jgi:uncharacterized protein